MLRRFHTAVLEKNETLRGGVRHRAHGVRLGERGDLVPAGGGAGCRHHVPGAGAGVPGRPRLVRQGGGWRWRSPGIGLHQLEVRHFGGWLRLRCDVRGDAPRVKLTVYLALKE